MRILITGGAGFIGSHLATTLHQRGHQVTTYDRSPKPPQKGIRQIKGDVLNAQKLTRAVNQHDAAVNLVGRLGTAETIGSPDESVKVNVAGALRFFDAVRQFGKPAVHISMGAYTWPNTYSITKYASERFALMYNSQLGTRIAVVRAMNVYGPGQRHAPVRKVVPTFIFQALNNQPLTIFGDGKQRIDLIFVRDCVEVIIRALLKNQRSYDTVFEAGTGNVITVNSLAKLIIRLTRSRAILTHVPLRPGEPRHSLTKADTQTLKPLGIAPTGFTTVQDGLKQTIDWYEHRNRTKRQGD